MNVLIVYESQFGNTQRIAEAIAETLRKTAQVTIMRVSPDIPVDLSLVDLLILGCPIISWKPSMGMQGFMIRLKPSAIKGKPFACFDTRIRGPKWIVGDACEGMTAQLSQLGALAVSAPEKFIVRSRQGPLERGEVERAVEWANSLVKKMGKPT